MTGLTRPCFGLYTMGMTDTPNISTVRARRAEISRLRKGLDEEDQELAIAERALARLAASAPATNGTATFGASALGTPATKAPVTHKDLVIATLKMHPEPYSKTRWASMSEK